MPGNYKIYIFEIYQSLQHVIAMYINISINQLFPIDLSQLGPSQMQLWKQVTLSGSNIPYASLDPRGHTSPAWMGQDFTSVGG